MSSTHPCRFANVYPNGTESKKARPLNNEMAYADTPKGAGINSGYAFDVAKLQKNTETTKDKEQKRALETVVPGDGSPFKATAVSSVDGAKISNNSDIAKYFCRKVSVY